MRIVIVFSFLIILHSTVSAEPRTFAGGMNKDHFVMNYINATERQRIASTMCQPASFIMSCIGAVTKANKPEDNGKKLTTEDCQSAFVQQIDLSLSHNTNPKGMFYHKMPVNVSNAQAKTYRLELVKSIHSTLVNALSVQGAPVQQDQACVMKFMNSLQEINAL